MPDQYDFQQLRQRQQYGPANPYFTPGPNAPYGPPNPFFNPPPDIGGYQDFSLGPEQDYGHIDPFMVDTSGGDGRQYGQQIPSPTAPSVSKYGPTEGDPRNPNRIWEMINKIYTPETQSRDRVNTLLDNAPEREEPNWARRLVASGMGFGQKDPIGTMENVMYAPHNRAMADWTAKTKPFQEAYQAENTSNINERQLAGNAVAAQTAQDRADQQYRINEEKIRQGDEKNAIARIIALAREFQMRNPDMEIVQPPGGFIMGVNPKTGKQTYILDDQGQRISSGKISEDVIANIKGGYDVRAAQAGATQRENTAIETGPIYVDPDTKKVYRITPNGMIEIPRPGGASPTGILQEVGKPNAAANRPQTPAAMEYDRQRRMEFVYQNYPDYKNEGFIRYNSSTGKFTLGKRPEPSWFNTHLDSTDIELGKKYDKMMELLGEGVEPPTGMTKPVPREGAVNTPDDKARAAIRDQVATQAAGEPDRLRALLADPNTPARIKPNIQRALDELTAGQVPAQLPRGTQVHVGDPMDQSTPPSTPRQIRPPDQGDDVYVSDALHPGSNFYMRADAFAIAQKQSPGRFTRVR